MTKKRKLSLFALPVALCLSLTSLFGCEASNNGGKKNNNDDDNWTVAELTDPEYTIPGVDTSLEQANGGKFYPATATKAEADAIADQINRQLTEEGEVLLYNNGVLPLAPTQKKITLMGVASQDIVVAGGGSGKASQNNQSTKYDWNNAFAEEGFTLNPTIVNKYKNYLATDIGSNGLHIEMGVDKLGKSEQATYKAYGDAAVLVFYRWSQENQDLATYNAKGHSNPEDTELDLQDNEKALIRHANEHFDNVIVIINSSYTMAVGELADPTSDLGVDAILWVGGVGQVGCLSAVKILDGKVNPSGHLPDTWWADLKADPAFTNVSQMNQNAEGTGRSDAFFRAPDGTQTPFALVEYREGIYMGHRYYETVYDDMVAAGKQAEADAWYNSVVAFPFGYGCSYTTFEWKLAGVSKVKTITTDQQYITLQVQVQNTGSVAGKDVVELYNVAPYYNGGIEKASAALVGFAKTKMLAPGEKEIVTIQILAHDLASYDWNDANNNGFTGWELEHGTYTLSLRRSSHDVVINTEFTVESDITCPIDPVSGNEVTNVFTDDDWWNFETVRDDLLENSATRATGVTQPAPVSLTDRTLTEAEYNLLKSEEVYYPYMDNPDQPWYVALDGIPSNWTQATAQASTADLKVLLEKLSGVPYTDPKIVNGKLDFSHLTAEQKANNALWDAYMNALTYDQVVSYYASAKGPVTNTGLTGGDGPVTFGGGADWATCPVTAATWNIELIEDQGEMLGTQALLNGTSGWRGGGINTHRTPFNGRCFEYYSEDGVLAAKVAAAVDTGVTSKGIMCYWKHYFGNDQEYRRANFGGVSLFATEQALREIYLRPFEAVIKNGTSGVMTSFNRLGWTVNSNNWATHQKLLRDEWGYTGGTVNDQWAKTYVSQDLMVRAGDTFLMGSWNGYEPNGLTWGKWDATQRGGLGLPLVPDADAKSQNVKDGTVPSATQYYVMRIAAIRDVHSEVNSCVMKNNATSMTFEATVIAGDTGTIQPTSTDTSNFTITKTNFNRPKYNTIEPVVSGTTKTYTGEGFEVVETSNNSGVITSIKYTDTTTGYNFTDTYSSGAISKTSVYGYITCTLDSTGAVTKIAAEKGAMLGDYEIPVVMTVDSWVKNVNATITVHVVSPLTINGAEITADTATITMNQGATTEYVVSSNYYAFMNKNSNTNFICITAYNAGSGWLQRKEDESASDIITLDYDAVKDQPDLQKHEPLYEIVGAPEGVTAEAIMENPVGYCGLTYTSQIMTGMKIKGLNTLAKGEYTFTLKLTTYTVNKQTGGNWIRATSGTAVTVQQQIKVVVA